MEGWADDWTSEFGSGGISLSAEISTQPSAPAPAAQSTRSRRAERVAVELGAGLRQRGASGVTVQVVDLSTDGFKAATHLELFVGNDVWLRLPGLEPCHATVMWTEGPMVGCAFERPLHPAVLDMIIGKRT